MSRSPRSEHDHLEETRDRLLDAALVHVPFEGWTEKALKAAIRDTGVDPGLARLAFPRGGIDMALHFHRRADRQLARELAAADLSSMRIRERIVHAVRRRIELVAEDREAVRRAVALFALPPYVPDGARALWATVDTIWRAIGDTTTDYNWYTKRMTLAAVYSAMLLYWLGDTSPGFANSWDFLERRIDEVMRFEKTRAGLAENPLVRLVCWGPTRFLRLVRAPGAGPTPEASSAPPAATPEGPGDTGASVDASASANTGAAAD